jgi:hypothetical protein
MWNSRAVQRNVALLRADGAYVIEPTVIFGAADVASQGEPMYGGHGTLWSGPQSLMAALIAISDDRRHRLAGVPLGRGTEAAPGAR